MKDFTRMILIILQEECGEVVQIVSKIFRFGPEDTRAEEPGLTTRDRLVQECGDVLAMIDMLKQSELKITQEELEQAKRNKLIKLQQYL